jgi:hypothetical protein
VLWPNSESLLIPVNFAVSLASCPGLIHHRTGEATEDGQRKLNPDTNENLMSDGADSLADSWPNYITDVSILFIKKTQKYVF